MRWFSPILLTPEGIERNAVVSVTDGRIRIEPFAGETERTVAVEGVVLVTDKPVYEIPARLSGEPLTEYATRLNNAIGRQKRGGLYRIVSAGFSVEELGHSLLYDAD